MQLSRINKILLGDIVLRLIAFLVGLTLALSANAQTASLKSPNISANALFLYRNSNFHKEDSDTERNGMDIQETEVALYSDVDPYSRLTMILSIHPNYEPDKDHPGKIKESWQIEPEEL